jgi:hypothetical protein
VACLVAFPIYDFCTLLPQLELLVTNTNWTCLVACLIYDFSTLITLILLIFTDKNKEKSVVYPYNPCAKVRKEVIFNPTKQAH